ncbi:MAG: ADP-ribosylglycohydrolase family protein [Dysgonamonadaceae bacterium]
MIGAIIGDNVGSIYEFNNHRSKEFELFTNDSEFTDDTVCIIALADYHLIAIDKEITSQLDVTLSLAKWFKNYPFESYGTGYLNWVSKINKDNIKEIKHYNSYGNGAAMRVSPMGDIASSIEDAIRNAISIGGDSDTLAAITGGVAEAFYKDIPEWILEETMNRLPEDMIEVISDFHSLSGLKNKYPKIVESLNRLFQR